MNPTTKPTSSKPSTVTSVRNHLRFGSAFFVASGLFVLLGSSDLTDWPVELFGDLTFWPLGDDVQLSRESALLSAIGGGVMIGWGVSFWGLTSLLETAPTAVRRIIALSIGSWFIFDSLGSLLAGAPLNVVFNVGYLLLFAVPLRRLGAVLDTGTTTEPTRNPVVA